MCSLSLRRVCISVPRYPRGASLVSLFSATRRPLHGFRCAAHHGALSDTSHLGKRCNVASSCVDIPYALMIFSANWRLYCLSNAAPPCCWPPPAHARPIISSNGRTSRKPCAGRSPRLPSGPTPSPPNHEMISSGFTRDPRVSRWLNPAFVFRFSRRALRPLAASGDVYLSRTRKSEVVPARRGMDILYGRRPLIPLVGELDSGRRFGSASKKAARTGTRTTIRISSLRA